MMKHNNRLLRATAAGLSVCVLSTAAVPALAAAPVPTYDEALYVTLDPYGAAKESSVVKSYSLNGATSITDRGGYSKVANMTNYVSPVQTESTVTFDFGSDAPERFYFEGTTDAPLDKLPWKIDVSYKLNGVPTAAEKLAGAAGVVQIDIDLTPNTAAPAYYRNNLMMQVAALVDIDEALSVEAEGSQLQSVGNLKAVVFMALPGQEEHFTIRIGSNDFSFAGLTFLMMPATVSQLEQITELRENKDKLRDAADAMSASLDVLLSTMNSMQSSLQAAAGGLDQLAAAQATFSAGKGSVYNDIDTSLADLTALSGAMAPLNTHLTETQSLLTETNGHLNTMAATADSLRPELESLRKIIKNTQTDVKNLRELAGDLETVPNSLEWDLEQMNAKIKSLNNSLRTLKTALNGMEISDTADDLLNNQEVDLHDFDSSVPAGTTLKVSEIKSIISTVGQLESAYTAAVQGGLIDPAAVTFQTFATQKLTEAGKSTQEITLFLGVYAKKDVINAKLSDISNSVGSVTGPLSDVADETAVVCGRLADLLNTLGENGLGGELQYICETLDDYTGTLSSLLGDADDGGDLLTRVSKTADKALDQLDALNETLNTYEPLTQQALEDAKTLSTTATTGLDNLNALLTNLRGLSAQTGQQLDPGTQQTLSGTAAILRGASAGFAQTGTLQHSKDIIKDIFDDEMDTLENDSNLLNVDPSAAPVSLTSEENPAPQSLQIILRTEEITSGSDDSETVEYDEDFHASGSFLSRLGAIFTTIKNKIVSLFA